MQLKKKISIRYKFLLVTTALLIICMGAYLFLVIDVFKKDKVSLVYDLNRSVVANLISEFNIQFHSLSDKLELFAVTGMPETANLKDSTIIDLIEKDSDIVFLSLRDPISNKEIKTFTNKKFLSTYKLDQEYFTQSLTQSRPVPLNEIMQQGEALWNATVPNGAPLIGYGRSVLQENSEGIPYSRIAVIAYMYPQKLMSSLEQSKLSRTFIFSSKGELLLTSDNKINLSQPFSKSKSLEEAIISKEKTKVWQFKEGNTEKLAALSKGFRDQVIVYTEVEGERVFSVVSRLVYRTVLFAAVIFTLAFLVAVLFSRSLTKPIDVLVKGMGRVSEGNLDTQIEIRSQDEIALLAFSFNDMIRELKSSREQLIEINRDLEQKVKDRTRRLEEQNQAVKETQEALLRTTRLAAAGEIAGRAAHEVLNPLTNIFARVAKITKRINDESQNTQQLFVAIKEGWIEDYQQGGFERLVQHWREKSSVSDTASLWDEDIENLEMIHQQWREEKKRLTDDCDFLLSEGSRINRIVQQMRSFNIVRGQKASCAIQSLNQECCKIMSDLFEQKKVKLTEEYLFGTARVLVDRDEFIQSVTNLLRNSLQAVLATGRKDGEVKVRQSYRDGLVVISIEDNGAGIKLENQNKLFESQFSTKDPTEGTGLGLSISRRFMRAYGGDIQFVSSEENIMTVFEITLPLETSNS